MVEKKYKLTREGVEALEQELEHLTVVKRREIAEKLQEARAQGDLSENAEYDAAKDEQRDVEARIEEIEKILKRRFSPILKMKTKILLRLWNMRESEKS